jgi:hypothetical protein
VVDSGGPLKPVRRGNRSTDVASTSVVAGVSIGLEGGNVLVIESPGRPGERGTVKGYRDPAESAASTSRAATGALLGMPERMAYTCDCCGTTFAPPRSRVTLRGRDRLAVFGLAVGRAVRRRQGVTSAYRTIRPHTVALRNERAFEEFVAAFRYCGACGGLICETCWDPGRQLCGGCVGDMAARPRGERVAVGDSGVAGEGGAATLRSGPVPPVRAAAIPSDAHRPAARTASPEPDGQVVAPESLVPGPAASALPVGPAAAAASDPPVAPATAGAPATASRAAARRRRRAANARLSPARPPRPFTAPRP